MTLTGTRIGNTRRRTGQKYPSAGAVVGKVTRHLCWREIGSSSCLGLPQAEPFVIKEPESLVPTVITGNDYRSTHGSSEGILREGRIGPSGTVRKEVI